MSLIWFSWFVDQSIYKWIQKISCSKPKHYLMWDFPLPLVSVHHALLEKWPYSAASEAVSAFEAVSVSEVKPYLRVTTGQNYKCSSKSIDTILIGFLWHIYEFNETQNVSWFQPELLEIWGNFLLCSTFISHSFLGGFHTWRPQNFRILFFDPSHPPPLSLSQISWFCSFHLENDRKPNFCYLPNRNILLNANYSVNCRIAEYRIVYFYSEKVQLFGFGRIFS